GLTVYSDRTFTSQGCTFIKGENQMNGREALIFARDRENQEDGDNDRGLHQMAVVKAIIEKMSSKRALLTGYGEMLDSLKGMFSTDMSAGSLSDLIKMQLDDMASWNIIPYAVTGENASDTTYSMPGTRLSVMYPDADSVARASELIAKMKEGGNLSAAGLLPADSASGDTAQGNAA
ncbi:MAG: LCP family protein, partial [Firmicutes bacterium]|nr:LCP family protein [Bacillota bacterium]